MTFAKKSNPTTMNRVVYILFFGLGIVFLVFRDYNNAIIFSGLAPVFDPFDPKVKFADRKKWQNGLLLLNLLISFTALTFLILK